MLVAPAASTPADPRAPSRPCRRRVHPPSPPMRHAVVPAVLASLAALGACASGRSNAAPEVTYHSGPVVPGADQHDALVHRVCRTQTVEAVRVTSAMTPPPLVLTPSFLTGVGEDVGFFFVPPEAPRERHAVVTATVTRGAPTGLALRDRSGDSAFDAAAIEAVRASGLGRGHVTLSATGGVAELPLAFSFGRGADGIGDAPRLRTECPAAPLASNPTPHFPLELRERGGRGLVVARFVVDTLGIVQPETFTVVSSTHDLFTREVRGVLPSLRYMPAEVFGHKVPQLTEQRFTFETDQRNPHQ